jgi:hypothetical protein
MVSTRTPAGRTVERPALPTWVKPQLAALVKQAPDGSDWLHEIKFDGYRMHARLDAGRVQIVTRRGNIWTDKYPAIAEAIAALPAKNAYLDGELCGVLPDGRTAFNLIQNASDTGQGSLVFFLFDLLFVNGEDITALPLVDRKGRLKTLLKGASPRSSTMTTRSAMVQRFTGSPASMGSKASSRSASVAGTSPTGAPSLSQSATRPNRRSIFFAVAEAVLQREISAAGQCRTNRLVAVELQQRERDQVARSAISRPRPTRPRRSGPCVRDNCGGCRLHYR